MAIIGETLAVPEYGFTRYELINKDDLTLNNEYFYSIGTFMTQDTNGLLAVGVSNGDEILVKIKNTYNFRLLVCLPSSTNANTLYTNNMVVEIDGVKHTFDLTSNQNTTIINNCLAVDIKNLSTNSHIVKIYADGNNNDTQMINVQAIDVDTKGIVGFTRTMASMFEGCTNLKKDIIIPKNADVVENMFKNCTSMTHVRSNWDETYNDSGIITEDCYSGCTSITHIDDVALSLNEYSNGLDNIPSEWGGYGFSKEYTGIYMVEILSPNYTFSFASDGLLDNGYINWGDGTTTKNEYSHTYVNAGVYIIKGKVHSTAETVTDSMKLCLKEILQYPIYGNLAHAFIGCTALVSANISGNKYHDIKGRVNVFQDCTNLERVIALDTKLEKGAAHISAFQNCKKLREIIGLEDFIYNTLNLMSCFNRCSSLPNFTLSEDSLKNCISFMLAFYDCTSLTESPIKTFNVPNISRIFDSCTNITDISGVTFGENITNADNWYPPNLTTANNVTIKNDVVSFQGNPTLQYCNNLRSYYAKSFKGCKALVELKNLLIKSEDGTVIDGYGAHAYRTCSKLKTITFDPNCKLKYTTCDFMFIENPLLEEVDFGGGVTLEPTQNGDSVFGSAIKTIKNMKVGGTSTRARFSGYSTDSYGINFPNLEYLDCTIMTQEASKFFKGSGIKDVSNIKFDASIRDLSESFMNNRLLLQDIEVQSHIRNCSSMFRNCTALTHIRSNWENSYTGGITATDCYSGCTAVTHIDDKTVIAYEGDVGIDYVPSEWGGNGFAKSNTAILRINLTSNNYEFRLCLDNSDNGGVTSWGDGTADTSSTHTYSTAGTYTLKTKKSINTNSTSVTLRATLTDILGLGNNVGYLFRECDKLKTVNMDDFILENQAISPLFYRSCNIEYISAKNVTIRNNGFGCLPSSYKLGERNRVLTEIVGIDTWKIETNNLSYLFKGYAKFESLDISNWNLENVTNMGNMFEWCESLTESPIKNLPNSVSNISNMFKGCTSLTHDIEIPSNVTNCSGMFQGCTSMTHIRSNWNNSYNYEITATDCYSGCTAITHIDDESVIAYEGDNSLDYIPSEWGGNGLVDDGTISIIEVTIPSDNFEYIPFHWCYCFSRRDGVYITKDNHINWGDGESFSTSGITDAALEDKIGGDIRFPAHTYAKAGVYYIKGHFGHFSVSPAENNGMTNPYGFDATNNRLTCITGIAKWASRVYDVKKDRYFNQNNRKGCFQNLTNLKYAKDLQLGNTVKNLTDLFKGCTSLSSVDFSGCDTSGVTSMEYMFNGCSSLTSLDLSGFDTRNVTTMQYMFYKCPSLTSLNLSSFNTSKVTTMLNMFYGCSSLASLDLSGFDTRNVTIMQYMFYKCSSLTSLNLSSFDTSKATTLTSVFQDCSSLRSLDLSSWNVSRVTQFPYIFCGCTALETLNISTWDMSSISDEYGSRYMFDKCDNLKSNPYIGIAKGHSAISSIKLTSTALPSELDFGGFTFGEKFGYMWEINVPKHITRVTGLRTAPVSTISFRYLNDLEYLDSYNIGAETGLPPYYYGGFINIPNGGVTILFIGDYTSVDEINFFLRYSTGQYAGGQGGLTLKLSAESLVSLISCLHDFASEGQTGGAIYFRPEAIARLTSSQLAVATNKGWTIVAGA